MPTLYNVPDRVLSEQAQRAAAELSDRALVRSAYADTGWDAEAFADRFDVLVATFADVFADRAVARARCAGARQTLVTLIDTRAARWIARLRNRVAALPADDPDTHLPRLRVRRDRPETYVRQLRLLRPELERVRARVSAGAGDPFVDLGLALATDLDAADLAIESARLAEAVQVRALDAARSALVSALDELDVWVADAAAAGVQVIPGRDRQVVRQWHATRPANLGGAGDEGEGVTGGAGVEAAVDAG